MQASFAELYEDINDALREAIRALGGNKKVGPQLWPDLSQEAAGNRLRDCLNPDRRDTLRPEQMMLVLRLAREAGFHAAMGFVAFECGYEPPRPVEPADQEAELQRKFMDKVDELAQIQKQMARTQALRRVG